jgi:uncharacterized membrane protein
MSAAKHLLVITAMLAPHAHAQEREQIGVIGDLATTAVGVGSGLAVEANPMALAGLPIRLALIRKAESLSEGDRRTLLDSVNAANVFAISNNVAVLLGIQAAPVIGMFAAAVVWKQGAGTREFMAACQRHKAVFPQDVAVPCVRSKSHG